MEGVEGHRLHDDGHAASRLETCQNSSARIWQLQTTWHQVLTMLFESLEALRRRTFC